MVLGSLMLLGWWYDRLEEGRLGMKSQPFVVAESFHGVTSADLDRGLHLSALLGWPWLNSIPVLCISGR